VFSPGLEARLLSPVRLICVPPLISIRVDRYAAAMGGTYEFTRYASANLREKDDSYNTALGGFFAGSIMGLGRE
jgi:hypothetical protein